MSNSTEKKEPLITVRNLSLGYDSHAILSDLNFTVYAGDYLCIVGENGSGKTTLMKTLLGLQEPMGGEIRMERRLHGEGIGYLPQQTQIQKDFPASVWEVVLSGCQRQLGWKPFYSRDQKQAARENMKRMGIDDLADRCYRDLSGGQQQRVLLARALCAAEEILLLDEPVSGLDPGATADMYELIDWLNREGITIMMISHDVGAALQYATHILHIGDGIFFGTRDAYLQTTQGQHFASGEGPGKGKDS